MDTQVEKVLKVVDEVCKKENIVIFDKVTRRRCDLLQFSTNGDPMDTDTPLRRIFFEIIDIILVGIELRFTNEAMDIIAASDMVVNQRMFSSNDFTERLDIQIPECESQFFKNYCEDELDRTAGLLDILKICNKETFPNVHSLLLSLAVCPISSVTVERFFSTVNRVMIPSRKSMSAQRLNDLCILSVERDLTLYLENHVNLVKTEYRKLLK